VTLLSWMCNVTARSITENATLGAGRYEVLIYSQGTDQKISKREGWYQESINGPEV